MGRCTLLLFMTTGPLLGAGLISMQRKSSRSQMLSFRSRQASHAGLVTSGITRSLLRSWKAKRSSSHSLISSLKQLFRNVVSACNIHLSLHFIGLDANSADALFSSLISFLIVPRRKPKARYPYPCGTLRYLKKLGPSRPSGSPLPLSLAPPE